MITFKHFHTTTGICKVYPLLASSVIFLFIEKYNSYGIRWNQFCDQCIVLWYHFNLFSSSRLGLVPVTESSVIVAVSSEHRRESLDAVTFLIDGLKAKVPIWKKELYSDGSGDWKRNKECVWGTDKKTDSAVNNKEIMNNNKSTWYVFMFLHALGFCFSRQDGTYNDNENNFSLFHIYVVLV